MNYREESKMVYEQSLRAYGYSDKIINLLLIGFDTGYSTGLLNGSDRNEQVEMLKKLLNEEVVN
ncbi:hypothetical protein [uncultured Metabacillus sp.]|uniref:hypothetical protein n=1 Tax=uncultured Metabacillus sp. TaxID=2860135 RepID=UPI002629A31F|nr:hypothetical protein [uncultured Metabacillus sp.]